MGVVYLDDKKIKFLKFNGLGKITNSGLPKKENDFEQTYIDLESIKVGEYPIISFNKYILGDKAVWAKLNYKITNIK